MVGGSIVSEGEDPRAQREDPQALQNFVSDDSVTSEDLALRIIPIVCGGANFVGLGIIAYAAMFFWTNHWFPAPVSHNQTYIRMEVKFPGFPTIMYPNCGIAEGTSGNEPQILLNDTWILKDVGTYDLREADANNLSYSGACHNIAVHDIVDAATRSPCTEWCERFLGSFAFNLACNAPTGLAPVVTACFKAYVSNSFVMVSPFLKYFAVTTYAAASASMGVLRWYRFKRSNPTWLVRRVFTRCDDPAMLHFVIPTTEGLKQKRLLQKLLITVAGDILTDFLTVLNLMKHGEPFFASGLLLIMAWLLALQRDDLFQSKSVSAWALSMEAGFPTKDLLDKSAWEGHESMASGVISIYVILASPAMGLQAAVLFSISMGFSLLSFHTGFVSTAVLLVMQKHPETEWDFDARLTLTADVFWIATLRWATHVALIVFTTTAILMATHRFVCTLWLLSGWVVGLGIVLFTEFGYVILMECVAGGSCATGLRKWTILKKYGDHEQRIWHAMLTLGIYIPWMVRGFIFNSKKADSVTLVPNLLQMGSFDEQVLAVLKAMILWTGILSYVASLYRFTEFPVALRYYRRPLSTLEALHDTHQHLYETLGGA